MIRESVELNRGQKLLMLYAKLHYEHFETEEEFHDHLALLASVYNGGVPTKYPWDLISILQKTCRAVFTDESYIRQTDERIKQMLQTVKDHPECLESEWARLAWQYLMMLQGARAIDQSGNRYLNDVDPVPLEHERIETRLEPKKQTYV